MRLIFQVHLDRYNADLAYCDTRRWPLTTEQRDKALERARELGARWIEFYELGTLRLLERAQPLAALLVIACIALGCAADNRMHPSSSSMQGQAGHAALQHLAPMHAPAELAPITDDLDSGAELEHSPELDASIVNIDARDAGKIDAHVPELDAQIDAGADAAIVDAAIVDAGAVDAGCIPGHDIGCHLCQGSTYHQCVLGSTSICNVYSSSCGEQAFPADGGYVWLRCSAPGCI